MTNLGCDEQLFRRIVKTVFNQRRKMLRVSLRQLLSADAIAALQQSLNALSPVEKGLGEGLLTLRPEQLSIPQFVDLTNHIAPLLAP